MEPGGAARTTVPGVRSQGGADWSTGQGGVKGLADQGALRESTHHSRAGDQKTLGGSDLQGRVNRGGDEGLEGASGGGAEGLTGFGRGGGRGRLGQHIISSDARETYLALPGIGGGRLSSSSSTKIPTCMDVTTGSHTWSDWMASLHSGTDGAAGSGSEASFGSGFRSMLFISSGTRSVVGTGSVSTVGMGFGYAVIVNNF